MYQTKHVQQRMSQRGLTKEIVSYVLNNGFSQRDKCVMNKKEALRKIAEIEAEKRILTKIADKGGVVVVAQGEAVITAYNFNS